MNETALVAPEEQAPTTGGIVKKSEQRAKDSEPRGIVVGLGAEEKHPGPFWAYLWSADDDTRETHWHEVVPVARSA